MLWYKHFGYNVNYFSMLGSCKSSIKSKVLIFRLIQFFSWCLYEAVKVCMIVCMLVQNCAHAQARRRHQTPWSWGRRQLWAAWSGWWQSNMSPLKQQYLLLTTKAPLQTYKVWFCGFKKKMSYRKLAYHFLDKIVETAFILNWILKRQTSPYYFKRKQHIIFKKHIRNCKNQFH